MSDCASMCLASVNLNKQHSVCTLLIQTAVLPDVPFVLRDAFAAEQLLIDVSRHCVAGCALKDSLKVQLPARTKEQAIDVMLQLHRL